VSRAEPNHELKYRCRAVELSIELILFKSYRLESVNPSLSQEDSSDCTIENIAMPWNKFAIAPPGSASSTGGIAAVSRVPNSMELWSVGQKGSIRGAFWYEGGDNWQRYQLAPAGSASPKGGIAAVSRVPNSMELWYIGQDGSVQGAFWYQDAEWQHYQLAPPGTAALNTDIAAISRVPNSMEVWFVGQNGSVRDYNWYECGNWQNFQLAQQRIPGGWDIGCITNLHQHGGLVHWAGWVSPGLQLV
jgi:hypothetical protein